MPILLGVLAATGGLAFWFFRNRASGVAGDVVESASNSLEGLDESITQSVFDFTKLTMPSLAEKAATVTNKVIGDSTSGARGIRNNNPGNIRRSGEAWQGLAKTQTDASFFQFTEARYGVRALAKILQTYSNKYGLKNVRDIINRWAPPSENNTASYVKTVAAKLGVSADEPIDVYARLPALATAIIQHENGYNPYTSAEIQSWVYL